MSKISELSDGGSLVSTDFLIAVRSGGNVKVQMDTINVDQVDLGDNEFIRLGNSQDLTLVHTSTQSIINQAGVGDLLIQKGGATKLTVNSSGIDVAGSVTASGEVFIAEKLTHTGDTDTHFRFAGPNDIRIVAGGVDHAAFDGTIVFNQSGSSTMDFRVESDTNEYMLYVDASSNRIGVGNNVPNSTLDVTGNVTALSAQDYQFTAAYNETNSTSYGYYGIKNNNVGNPFYFHVGGQERMRIDSSGHVGIGTASLTTLGTLVVQQSADSKGIALVDSAAANTFFIENEGDEVKFRLNATSPFTFTHNTTERMRINSSGNVGIGTTSPTSKLDINISTNARGYFSSSIGEVGTGNFALQVVDATGASLKPLGLRAEDIRFATLGGERMRIDASGNLLVGKTAAGLANSGFEVGQSGQMNVTQAGATVGRFNRKTSDGSILELAKDGTTVGSIDARGGDLVIRTGDTGIRFNDASNAIMPHDATDVIDNQIDIGNSSYRFRDLHLSRRVHTGDGIQDAGSAGSESVFNNGQTTANFRVAGVGSANTLFVDGGTNNVGIGTSSPNAKIHATTSASGYAAKLINTNGASDANGLLIQAGTVQSEYSLSVTNTAGTEHFMVVKGDGNVGIGTASPATTLDVSASTTRAAYLRSSATGSRLHFLDATTASITTVGLGAEGNNMVLYSGGAETMRIDSSGNLLVGTTDSAPGAGDTNTGVSFRSGGDAFFSKASSYAARFNRNTNDGDLVTFAKDGASVGLIGTGNSGNLHIGSGDTGINFNADINSVYPINPTSGASSNGAIDLGYGGIAFKDLYLSGGAYLGGTGAANKLDDYEEGSWTPTENNLTFTVATGRYTKIGNLVHAAGYVEVPTNTNGNAFDISLPFGSGDSSTFYFTCSVTSTALADTAGLLGPSGSGYIAVINKDTEARTLLSAASNKAFRFNITYRTA